MKFHDLNHLKPVETLNRHTSDINSSVNIIKRDNWSDQESLTHLPINRSDNLNNEIQELNNAYRVIPTRKTIGKSIHSFTEGVEITKVHSQVWDKFFKLKAH